MKFTKYINCNVTHTMNVFHVPVQVTLDTERQCTYYRGWEMDLIMLLFMSRQTAFCGER